MEYFLMRNMLERQGKPKSDKSNIETLLSKHINVIENKINKSEVIESCIIDDLVSDIKKVVEEHNAKINEFYDDKFYNDLFKFSEQISDSINKSLIYEETNFIIIK